MVNHILFDLIYNPLQTLLLKKADALGKNTANGLLMLVTQVIKAQEIWNSQEYEPAIYAHVYDFVYNTMNNKRDNIVLIGMPGSGKTSIGRQLAKQLNMDFIDTDSIIEEQHGSIVRIFETKGESVFRGYESEAAQIAAKRFKVLF